MVQMVDKLTLISATKEAIYIFALENIFTDPKWFQVRRMRYYGVSVGEKRLKYWDVAAYDGKSLVLTNRYLGLGVVHEYDVRAKKWEVIKPIPGWCFSDHDYYLFTQSLSSVIRLDDDDEKMEMSTYDDYKRFSSLSMIVSQINKISPYARKLLNKNTKLGKRLIDMEMGETKLIRLTIDQEASRDEDEINKRRVK